MDLPTYTNIWRIEKRLYKLYDFRLPMPLPVGTFGVALGVFALWVVLLSILNAPFAFGNGWHLVLWVVPPGVITVLATRPVIEGKRLTELLISQARFLTEARVFTRLAPEYEPAEIRVSVRVWHRDAEAGPLPLPRGARRAQTETETETESQAAPAEVQEPEEAPALESARRAAPPLRGVPARPPVPVVEHDDSVEYTPAQKVPVAVAAGAGADQEDDGVAEPGERSDDTSEEPRTGVGRRVLNYFGFGLPDTREEPAEQDRPGDFDEPLYVTEEDEQRDRDEWFARLRASSGETPLGLTAKSAYSDSDTGAMSSAELTEAVTPRPDASRRRAEEMMAAPVEEESPAARRLRGRTQGIQVAKDLADRRERTPEPTRERAQQAPPARPARARGAALPDTSEDRPTRQRREGRPHATPWAIEENRTEYPDLSDYATRFAAATGRPSAAGNVSAAPWLPPAAATPEDPPAATPEDPPAATPEEPESADEPTGRAEAGPQVSHATHGLGRPAAEETTKPPLQLDHGTGEHEAMPVEREHGTQWNEHMSVLDRHLIKADTPAPPRPKFADAVPSQERDGERRDPADWFDDGKRRHPDQPKVGDRDNPVIVVSELREERRAAAEARRQKAEKAEKPEAAQATARAQGPKDDRDAAVRGTGRVQGSKTDGANREAPELQVHDAPSVQGPEELPETEQVERAPDSTGVRDVERTAPPQGQGSPSARAAEGHRETEQVDRAQGPKDDGDVAEAVQGREAREPLTAAEVGGSETDQARGARDAGTLESHQPPTASGARTVENADPEEQTQGGAARAPEVHEPHEAREPVGTDESASAQAAGEPRVTNGAAEAHEAEIQRATRAEAHGSTFVDEPADAARSQGEHEPRGPEAGGVTGSAHVEGPKPPTQLDHGTGELVSFVEVRKEPRVPKSTAPAPRPKEDSAHRPTEAELAEAEAAALRARRSRTAPTGEPETAEREDAEQAGHDPHDGVFHRVAQNARRIGQLFGQPTPGEEPEPPETRADAAKPDLELDHGTGEQARLGDTPNGVPSQRTDPEPARSEEEPDSGSHSGGTRGWRRLAKVVTGGATPVRSDLPSSDIERLRAPLAEPRSLVVLGCTGGAGQTVTALMIGHTLAAHRDDRVVAVDVNPGPNGLSRRVGAQAPETLTALLANADAVDEYEHMRAYAGRAGTGLEVVQTLDDPYVQTLDDRDYGQLTGLLGGFYGVTLLDPAATGVARALPVTDGLVLVAPASADAERAVSMTFEWLDGNGYATLRANSILVVNGVSKRSLQDVDAAERVARGRCRAIVRIPWDDHLGSSYTKIDVGALRPATKRAHGALGGVLVNTLAPA